MSKIQCRNGFEKRNKVIAIAKLLVNTQQCHRLASACKARDSKCRVQVPTDLRNFYFYNSVNFVHFWISEDVC